MVCSEMAASVVVPGVCQAGLESEARNGIAPSVTNALQESLTLGQRRGRHYAESMSLSGVKAGQHKTLVVSARKLIRFHRYGLKKRTTFYDVLF